MGKTEAVDAPPDGPRLLGPAPNPKGRWMAPHRSARGREDAETGSWLGCGVSQSSLIGRSRVTCSATCQPLESLVFGRKPPRKSLWTRHSQVTSRPPESKVKGSIPLGDASCFSPLRGGGKTSTRARDSVGPPSIRPEARQRLPATCPIRVDQHVGLERLGDPK